MGAGAILAAIARGHFPTLLLASLAGWVALLGAHYDLVIIGYCSASADSLAVSGWSGMEAAFYLNSPAGLILSWQLMLLAMMPPLLVQPIAHLWDRSLARRRLRAIAVFVAGYGAVWMAVGIILTAMAVAIRVTPGAARLAAIIPAAALAILWQISPLKQTCLNHCHRLPRLSAFGLSADLDCLRYGLTAGLWCSGTCWALMLIPLTAESAHLPLMAIIAVVLLAERLAPARPARWRLPVPSGESGVFMMLWSKQGRAERDYWHSGL